MNSEQRKSIRAALEDAGLDRVSYTKADKNNCYKELWTGCGAVVKIEWLSGVPDLNEHDQETADSFEVFGEYPELEPEIG